MYLGDILVSIPSEVGKIYFGEILIGNAKEEITEPEENLNYITVEVFLMGNGGSND